MMLKTHSTLRTFAVFCAALLGLAAALAQPSPANVPTSYGQLDTLLAAKKWNDLGAALSHATSAQQALAEMDWLHSRIDLGGGSFLGFLYARDLWVMGSSLKIDDPARDPRITAGLISLYTYELIMIDGAKCRDRSAPENRMQQLLMTRGATLAYLRTKPAELKATIVETAIALEKKTAPLRQVDDLLCRGGMEEMMAGIEAGTTREVQSPTMNYGKTVAVEPPPNHEPQYLPPEAYLPVQAQARSSMKVNLLKLVQ